MLLIAGIVMLVGALALLGAITFALLQPRKEIVADENDTMLMEKIGPPDGQLIRVEGRVVVASPMRAPGGADCALYELYAGKDGEPARALRQKGVRFAIDDGVQAVWIDPVYRLVTYDLPAAVVDSPQMQDRTLIVRQLHPGARVEAVGCVWRQGAPGHEELMLLPPDAKAGITITWLG